MSITPTAAQLVVNLCGLFSSDHDGERASAAAKADAILRKHGLTWADVIRPEPTADAIRTEPPVEAKIRLCIERYAIFNEWNAAGSPPPPRSRKNTDRNRY